MLSSVATSSSALGDLVPVLAIAIVIGGVLALILSAPRGQDSLRDRTNDLRSFAGLPAKEAPSVAASSGETVEEGPVVATPIWESLDFSIFDERPDE